MHRPTIRTLRDVFWAPVHWLRLGGNAPIVVLSVLIGILGGFGAIGFRLLIRSLQGVGTGSFGPNIDERLVSLHWLHLMLLPIVGGVLVSALVQGFAKEAKGHGVPEVMEAVALRGGRIRKRVVAVKSLASALCIASGGSVGREGPIVQIGSALGSVIGQWLRAPRERLRLLVGCGAAAGIAGTFNAPVAGVMFAIEIILGNYAITTLTPLILSSVVATVVCHAFPSITGGNVRAFSIPFEYSLASIWEIPGFFVLGGIAAMVALAFIISLNWFEVRFDAIRMPAVAKGAVGGLALGAIYVGMRFGIGHVHLFGIGYPSIEAALRGELTWQVLALLVVGKLVCTGVTIGAGGSGGIFAPSLFMGAMAGGAFASAMAAVLPAGIPIEGGAYALVGMGAVLAGTTHATITAILIIFELTGDYQIILPLMIACVISGLITTRLKKDSIYTQKLTRRGIDLQLGVEATIMRSALVGELMSPGAPTVETATGFREVLGRMLDETVEELYVTDEGGVLEGIIGLNDVKAVMTETGLDQVLIAADLMDRGVLWVTPQSTLLQCIDKFAASGQDELAVVESEESRRLIGLVTHRAVFQLYNREVLRQGNLGLKYVHGADGGARNDYVELADGHVVREVPVTKTMVGRTLRELDVRARFQVNVVSIRTREFDPRQSDCGVPDPGYALKSSDRLMVVGSQSSIEQFVREA